MEAGDFLIINSCEAHEYKGITEDARGLTIKLGYEFLGEEFYNLAAGIASERILHLWNTPLPEHYRSILEQLDLLVHCKL